MPGARAMKIRDRVKELRRVRARELRPNPRNWRLHPPRQHEALRGVLAEIGYADALLAREFPDGELMLIDGHLRAETTPDAIVPVLVLDVNEAEADKILLTHDPLAGLATVADDQFAALLADVRIESAAVNELLASIAGSLDAEPAAAPAATPSERRPLCVRESYEVVVECRDEEQQRVVFERMRSEGFRCRVLTL